MRTESEIRERLDELETARREGLDIDARREIDRLRWVLEIGPDLIEVPQPK